MKIGIIGAGRAGSVFAKHFRRLQYTVLIANPRAPQTVSQVAQETEATPVVISEAAKGVDLLVIAIPMKNILLLPKDFFSDLPATSPIINTEITILLVAAGSPISKRGW